MTSRPATNAEIYTELWVLAVTAHTSYIHTLNHILQGIHALPDDDYDRLRRLLPLELEMHLILRAQQILDDTP